MEKIFDVAVKVGTYEKDGETKGRYENVGAVMEGENGKFILLKRTFNPAGVPNEDNRDKVILSLFKPKEKEKPKEEDDW
ncbi:MAG: hypothetical protein A4E53_01685 [Pelotomaculum sp. PtaB.Bin104]|jgi:hypothetical protein|nr:MAG: hypothetical protein A4E53_01685 [Pelotomaculum sp. PtaB.Bin104]